MIPQAQQNEAFPPTTDALTPYDEAHMALYLSVLYARAEGTPELQIAETLFGIGPDEPERARAIVEAHYQRAVWLTGPGSRRVTA